MGSESMNGLLTQPIYSTDAAFRKVRYKVTRDNCKFPRAARGIECFDFYGLTIVDHFRTCAL